MDLLSLLKEKEIPLKICLLKMTKYFVRISRSLNFQLNNTVKYLEIKHLATSSQQ